MGPTVKKTSKLHITRPHVKGTIGGFPTQRARDVEHISLPLHHHDGRRKLNRSCHYSDVTMGAMASQITNLTIVYSPVYSGVDQRKHQSSAPLAFVRGIHRWPVNSPNERPVFYTEKCFHLMTSSCAKGLCGCGNPPAFWHRYVANCLFNVIQDSGPRIYQSSIFCHCPTKAILGRHLQYDELTVCVLLSRSFVCVYSNFCQAVIRMFHCLSTDKEEMTH